MVRKVAWSLLGLIFGSLAAVHCHAQVEMARLPTVDQRVERLEAELATLRAAVEHGDGGCCDACDPCCSPYAGWTFAAEAVFLKAYTSRGIEGADGTQLRYDLNFTPRFWAGYTTADGLGFRLRYWEFDESAIGPSAVAGRNDSHSIDTYVLDFEVTDWVYVDNKWDVLVSGGLRYVDFEQSRLSQTLAGGQALGRQFGSSSLGATLGGEVHRRLFGDVSLFATGRASVLFGDDNEIQSFNGVTVNNPENDNLRYIWESQLGAEWSRDYNQATVFLRAAAEVQYWNNFIGEPGFDGSEALGFAGFALTAGVLR
jgi:hypothetical protein